jgi:hypothetical protein
LVKEGERRALVAFPIGRVIYFEKNFGQTPASNVEMYIRIVPEEELPEGGIPDLDPCKCARVPFMKYVPPEQNIGKVVGGQTAAAPFFLYGYILYEDIFKEKYLRRFAFIYDPARGVREGDAWIIHHDHNDERETTADEWARLSRPT